MRVNPTVPCPAASFEETRAEHLEQFSRTSPDERMEWLGQMLEVMQLAHEARMKKSGADPNGQDGIFQNVPK